MRLLGVSRWEHLNANKEHQFQPESHNFALRAALICSGWKFITQIFWKMFEGCIDLNRNLVLDLCLASLCITACRRRLGDCSSGWRRMWVLITQNSLENFDGEKYSGAHWSSHFSTFQNSWGHVASNLLKTQAKKCRDSCHVHVKTSPWWTVIADSYSCRHNEWRWEHGAFSQWIHQTIETSFHESNVSPSSLKDFNQLD